MTKLKFYKRLTIVSCLVLVLLNHFAFGFLGFFIPFAKADAVTWIGLPNVPGFWDDATKWSGGVVPTSADDVIIAGDDIVVFVMSTTTINFSTLSLEGPDVRLLLYGNIGSGGDITVTESLFFQANTSTQTISGDLVFDNGFFGTPPSTPTTTYGINFAAENIDIGPGSEIDVHGTGFPGGPTSTNGYGDGAGQYNNSGGGAGGGNAGYGGIGATGGFGGGPTCNFLVYTMDGPIVPDYPGSGGGGSDSGSGGAGGGLITLTVADTLTIDGRIQAHGNNYLDTDAGGGAGGTIFITAGTVTGTPQSFDAYGGNGSDPNGGGGSGGCVRVRYENTSSLVGTDIDVHGGDGYQKGAAGIAMIEKTDRSDRRLFINTLTTTAYGAPFNFTYESAETTLGNILGSFYDAVNSISISTSSVVSIGQREIAITDTYPFAGSTGGIFGSIMPADHLGLTSGAIIENVQIDVRNQELNDPKIVNWESEQTDLDLTISTNAVLNLIDYSSTTPLEFNSFTVQSGGLVTQGSNNPQNGVMVNIHAYNITIEAGGIIDVTGKGWQGGYNVGNGGENGQGPGGGEFVDMSTAAGAGHGGEGTASTASGASAGAGGTTYCDVSNPSTLGSGGSGGFFFESTGVIGGKGGGVVWLSASNTIQVDGEIIADGTDGSYNFYVGDVAFESTSGGGSGGSVKLDADRINQSGTISVKGGNNGVDPDPEPTEYGGGGGGCVRIHYTDANSSISTSTIELAGGGFAAGIAEDGQSSIVKENELSLVTPRFHNPVITGAIQSNANLDGIFSVQARGNYAYVASMNDDSFRVIDITSSTNPTIVGGIKDSSDLDGATNVALDGNYAYVTTYTDNSLRIIDISNPASPTMVGGIKDNTNLAGAADVVIDGDYAYVTTYTDNSLRVIDISNPASPTMVGGIKDNSLLESPISLAISGSYAYVASFNNHALRVIDISNPASPTIVGGIRDTERLVYPNDVAVKDGYAYLTSVEGIESLVIVDVSDPESPELIRNVVFGSDDISEMGAVALEGQYAYVTMRAGSRAGIGVIDISNPLEANFVGYYISAPFGSGTSKGIDVAGKYAYIAEPGTDSLFVADISLTGSPEPTIGFDVTDNDRQQVSVKAEYRPGLCMYTSLSLLTIVTSTATSTYGMTIDNSDADDRRIKNISVAPSQPDYAMASVTTTWDTATDLSGEEGEYCVYLTSYDGVAEGERVHATVIVDNPMEAPGIPDVSFDTTTTAITLTITSSGGVSYYTVSSTAVEGSVQIVGNTYTFGGLTPNTSYIFQIKATDSYGNSSAFSAPMSATTDDLPAPPPTSGDGGGSFTPPPPPPDTTPSSTPTSTPSNPSGLILINNGAYYTNSRSVVVSFNTDFTTAYILSDTPDFTGRIYTPIVSSTSFLLNPLDGEKRIYARFSNTYGVYDAYDVIVLDTLAPTAPTITSFVSPDLILKSNGVYGRKNTSSTIRIKPTLGGTAEPGTRIVITASYGGTNIVMMALAAVETYYTTADGSGNWSFTFPTELQNTYYTVSVQSEDGAENRSSPVTTEFDLRTAETPPCTVNCEPLEEIPPEEPPIEEPPFVPPIEEPETTPPGEPPCTTDCGAGGETPVGTGEQGTGTSEEATTDASTGGDSTESTSENIISNITDSVSVISDTIGTFFAEVGDSLQEIPLVRGIVETASIAAEKTREVIDNPTVEKTNEVLAAPILAAAAVANVAVGGAGLLSQVMLYLRLIFSQPLLLLKLRKRKSWGVVFNAYTKQPLDLATVRLLHGETKSITRTQVTDAKGRYFMVAEDGTYALEAQKEGFARHHTTSAEDSVYPNLYHGEKLELAEDSNEINYNIPLEPIMEEHSNTHLLREYAKKATHKTISLIGALATIVSLIISPKPSITALLAFHLILYGLMKRLAHKKIKGTSGAVTDSKTNKPIGKVIIRVFDATYNKLVETAVTDSKGRYVVLVGPSTYYITAEKEGYDLYKSGTMDFSSEKTGGVGGVIFQSFSLEASSFHEKSQKLG